MVATWETTALIELTGEAIAQPLWRLFPEPVQQVLASQPAYAHR